MRISFGGSYVPYTTDEEPIEGQSQTFAFETPTVISSTDIVEIPLEVTTFGDGTIGYLKLRVYLTIPDLADLSFALIHPAWNPLHFGSGLIGYHVVNEVVEARPSGIADLGESAEQPVVFVWNSTADPIREYTQDAFGEFCVEEDFSNLYGLPIAGEWYLWLYDYNGPRDGVVLEFAELEIFDGNSTPPDEPSTPIPSLVLSIDGLDLTMDSSGTTGGVAPLKYFWEIYTGSDELVNAANVGFPSTDPVAVYTLPGEGEYLITARVTSDTNGARVYLVRSIIVTD